MSVRGAEAAKDKVRYTTDCVAAKQQLTYYLTRATSRSKQATFLSRSHTTLLPSSWIPAHQSTSTTGLSFTSNSSSMLLPALPRWEGPANLRPSFRWTQAEADASRAIKLDPINPKSLYRRGLARVGAGNKLEQARQG